MAQFIELPYGIYNSETKQNEKTSALVNVASIISIEPYGDYMCKVAIKGKQTIFAYRRYDSLKAQITNRSADLLEVFPGEEIAAAYKEGYDKGLANSGSLRAEVVSEFVAHAVDWLSRNPLIDDWRKKFHNDMVQI